MRDELKILFLGIGILAISGFGLAAYHSFNLSLNKLSAPAMEESVAAPPPLVLPPTTELTLLVGTSTLRLELATTSADRARGLSGRADLAPDTGLLFVFDQPGFYGFWMKEMNFLIDIIWLTETGKIAAITEAAHPASYPKIFYPPEAIKYVIEVNAYYAREHQLVVGDQLEALPKAGL